MDISFQDQLIVELDQLTSVALTSASASEVIRIGGCSITALLTFTQMMSFTEPPVRRKAAEMRQRAPATGPLVINTSTGPQSVPGLSAR